MEFFEAVNNRHSVRAYKNKEIEEKKLNKILEASIRAPSAGNRQAYKIVIIRDETRKKKLAEIAADQQFIAEASVCLVFFADPQHSARKYGRRGAELYCIQDATIAAAYAQLAASAQGLGSAWIGSFDAEALKEMTNAKDLMPVAIIPVGYPDEEPDITTRRKMSDTVAGESL